MRSKLLKKIGMVYVFKRLRRTIFKHVKSNYEKDFWQNRAKIVLCETLHKFGTYHLRG